MSDNGNGDSAKREEDVCRMLGVGEKIVRELRRRHLHEQVHWTRDRSGRKYTDEAVRILAQALSEPDPTNPLPFDDVTPETEHANGAAETGIPGADGAELKPGQRIEDDRLVEDLTVTKVWPDRKRMLLARRTATGDEVVLQIQNTEHVREGTTLRGCYRGEYKVWYYNGVLPRSRTAGIRMMKTGKP